MTLKEYILKSGLKQYEFAQLVPCTPAFISQLCNGHAKPKWKMALRIEEITGGEVEKENWFKEDDEIIGE